MKNKIRAVRNPATKMITAKGYLDGLVGQPKGTIMNMVGMRTAFDNLSKLLNVEMTDFFQDKNDDVITFDSYKNGTFKITIYDPKSITSLTDGQNRSFLMD